MWGHDRRMVSVTLEIIGAIGAIGPIPGNNGWIPANLKKCQECGKYRPLLRAHLDVEGTDVEGMVSLLGVMIDQMR